MTEPHHLGPSGHIARVFQNSQLTPLLALIGVLAGIFVVIVTHKEEEPQIDVTMADITVPFPGASAREVESLISTPGEQILDEVQGVVGSNPTVPTRIPSKIQSLNSGWIFLYLATFATSAFCPTFCPTKTKS